MLLYQVSLCKFFPPVCGLSSNSLDNIFHRAGVFSFNGVQLINDFFHGLGLWASPCSRSFRFSPMLSSKSFISLHFTFMNMIRLELIFVMCVRSVSILICFSTFFWYPVVLAPFVVETTLFHCITLPILSRVN